ncbi:MAG: hypothetical protein ACTIL3_12075, partial [Brevibacterium aurantiacum]
MDVDVHQPGEELADFTENELLSLIDLGTAGAYSEIYRRYRDDAVARATSSLPPAQARQVADDAFLNVLRSLLNGSADTAEGLQPMVDVEIDSAVGSPVDSEVDSASDENLASSTPPRGQESHDDAPAEAEAKTEAEAEAEAPVPALLSQA